MPKSLYALSIIGWRCDSAGQDSPMDSAALTLDMACITDAGGRPINEDFAGYEQAGDTYCLMVADGVGGYRYGEYAARLAVQSIRQSFRKEPLADETTLRTHMRRAAQCISQSILEDPKLRTMHTTLSVVYFDATHIVAGHVGDSRIYVFHDKQILYCSRDHSLVMQMVLRGELCMEEIRGHPKRNVITSALGSAPPKNMDIIRLDCALAKGDGILLCSDGFWELILEKEMRALLTASNCAVQWIQEMERVVGNRQSGRNDNYTCVAAMVMQ